MSQAERARDKLQIELDNPVIPAMSLSDEDADTIAELIEQRNTLASELEHLKNSTATLDEINIQDGEFDTIKLLQRNKELEEEIKKVHNENIEIKRFYSRKK